MCNPASFIVTKNNISFNPPEFGESHEDIMERYNIINDEHEIRGVSVEITPPNFNFSLPFSQWVFKVDQDLLPDWWNSKEAEIACRAKLPKWFKVHCIKENTIIEGGCYLVMKGSPNISLHGGICYVCGYSSPNISMHINAVCINLNFSKAKINMKDHSCKCYTYNNSSPNISLLHKNSFCITHDQSSPDIEIWKGGACDIHDTSNPNIYIRNGFSHTYDYSQPNIIMDGGLSQSYDYSKPNIILNKGFHETHDNSKPNIKKENYY